MPSGGGLYFKPEEGENRVRVLAPPIIGWIGWTAAGKPLRRAVNLKEPLIPTIDESEVVVDDKNVIRKFWALPVWDYKSKQIKVWEIGQSTIQGPIKKLAEDPDWGDPRRYDLSITRETKGERTSYTVSPKPKKKADPAIVSAWQEVTAAGFDMSRLFNGEDPFRPNSNGHASPSAHPSGQQGEDGVFGGDDMPPADDEIPFSTGPARGAPQAPAVERQDSTDLLYGPSGKTDDRQRFKDAAEGFGLTFVEASDVLKRNGGDYAKAAAAIDRMANEKAGQ
jgi:hypothetical protein